MLSNRRDFLKIVGTMSIFGGYVNPKNASDPYFKSAGIIQPTWQCKSGIQNRKSERVSNPG